MAGYRSVIRVGDTSTSSIASLAVGEVRVSGIVEPAELTLVSLLQSVPCVYYRSTVGSGRRSPDDRFRLHGGALDRLPRPRRDRAACGCSRAGRGSTPRSGSTARPTWLGDEPPRVSTSARGGSTRPAEIDAATGGGRAAHGPANPTRPSQPSRACGIGAAGGRYTESAARAGRPGHDRRPGTALLRPRRPGRRRPRHRRRICSVDDPEVAADLAAARPRARWPTTRPRPGATPRSRASGSGGRSRRRRSTRGANPLPSRRPTRPRACRANVRDRARDAGPGGLGRGAAADRLRHARERSSSAARTRFMRRDCSARSWPSRRRWSSPSTSAAGSVVTPPEVAAAFAVGLLVAIGGFIVLIKLQRCRGAPAADRQGVVEHRRRPQAAPRPAAQPRRRGPRPDGRSSATS